ncbi:MAG: hypothetical protein AB7Q37_06425 [Pyrinomonadaceae bacterium]
MTFTKTHAKGYSISMEDPSGGPARTEAAPGFDPRLPHDVAHFIVEDELGIKGGIIGQMAAGGLFASRTAKDVKSRRKAKRRGEALFRENKSDALLSEHAVYAAQSRWEKHEIIPDTKIPAADIARICERFEDFARQWSALPVGGSIELEWKHDQRPARKR